MHSIRLNKYISESGICSRREADRYIQSGNVLINGKKAKVTDQVFAGDKVMVNGQSLEPRLQEDNIYIAFNKPVGVTTTTEASTKGNIVDYVNHPSRIFPIGRLDKDSQGLIFLTNNGDIVNKILRASNNHQKEYLVTVNKAITDQFIDEMGAGIPILGATTKKCLVVKETPFIFKIVLVQGLNRQIRRMCEYLGYEVTKLERIRIMNVSLKGIPIGDWRELTELEVESIFKLIKNSSPVDKDSSMRKQKTASRNTIHRERKSAGEFQNKSAKRTGNEKWSGTPSVKAKQKGSRVKNKSSAGNSAWQPKNQTSKRGSKRFN